MKKIYLMPLAAMFLLTSCAGIIDSDDSDGDVVAPYTLSVDKAEIESDGSDEATFRITDANGKVLTDADHIRNTSLHYVYRFYYITYKNNIQEKYTQTFVLIISYREFLSRAFLLKI